MIIYVLDLCVENIQFLCWNKCCLLHNLELVVCPLCSRQHDYCLFLVFFPPVLTCLGYLVALTWFYKLCSWTHMDVWHITSRAQWNDLALPSFFFYLSLQAVETNLASKDSHWVYANEVSLNNTFLFLLLFIHISNHFCPLLISNVLRYTLYL